MKTVCFVVLALCFTGYVRGQGAAAGEACDPSGTPACAQNLVCETNSCKIKIGDSCADSTSNCVAFAACESDTCACPAATHTASADNTKCLLNIDQDCTAANSECIMNAECTSDTCSCEANYTPNADNNKCLLEIGQDCTAEGAMCVEGATCNTTCTCPAMSTANADKNKCLMYFGESCTESTDCVQDQNMKCTDKKCACTDDKYIPSDDFSMCRLKAGETCTGTGNECGTNAKCNGTTNKCHCDNGFEAEEGRCGKKVGETCGPNMPCVLNAMCNSENKCACKDNYTGDGGFCRSGSTAVVASVLLLIAALVTSRLM